MNQATTKALSVEPTCPIPLKPAVFIIKTSQTFGKAIEDPAIEHQFKHTFLYMELFIILTNCMCPTCFHLYVKEYYDFMVS